jgi:hypothetical protein
VSRAELLPQFDTFGGHFLPLLAGHGDYILLLFNASTIAQGNNQPTIQGGLNPK